MKENAQKIGGQISNLTISGNEVSGLLTDLAVGGEWNDSVSMSYSAYTQSMISKLKELNAVAGQTKASADKISEEKIDEFRSSLGMLSSELEGI